jgi:hypothetical protein
MKLQRWKAGGDAVDLHENFSLPLAFKVIYQLLGIPFEVGCIPLFLHVKSSWYKTCL